MPCELQKLYNKLNKSAIAKEEEEVDDESKKVTEEGHKNLSCRAPDHEGIGIDKDPSTHKYRESGVASKDLSTRKVENIDLSQKLYYHGTEKGNKKANGSKRRTLEHNFSRGGS